MWKCYPISVVRIVQTGYGEMWCELMKRSVLQSVAAGVHDNKCADWLANPALITDGRAMDWADIMNVIRAKCQYSKYDEEFTSVSWLLSLEWNVLQLSQISIDHSKVQCTRYKSLDSWTLSSRMNMPGGKIPKLDKLPAMMNIMWFWYTHTENLTGIIELVHSAEVLHLRTMRGYWSTCRVVWVQWEWPF